MTTIDWTKLTPREIYDALKSAPKVAGPWSEFDDGKLLARDTYTLDLVTYSELEVGGAVVIGEADVFGPDVATGDVGFNDRDAADEALRKAGWLLVDEDA